MGLGGGSGGEEHRLPIAAADATRREAPWRGEWSAACLRAAGAQAKRAEERRRTVPRCREGSTQVITPSLVSCRVVARVVRSTPLRMVVVVDGSAGRVARSGAGMGQGCGGAVRWWGGLSGLVSSSRCGRCVRASSHLAVSSTKSEWRGRLSRAMMHEATSKQREEEGKGGRRGEGGW